MNVIMEGDCRGVMSALPEEYVDAIVTDPPYDLGFMGKAWDKTGVAFDVDTWKQAIRVLKPGGHLLAFGGTRTYHRMATAVEDGGFEVRDMVQWLYGTGFPKSMNVGKAIDKAAGKERETGPVDPSRAGRLVNQGGEYETDAGWSAGNRKVTIDPPATPEAAQWEGWGTALKPACEPIILARKPLGEKTVAGNVLKWGVGALNVDGTRIGFASEADKDQTRVPQPIQHNDARGVYMAGMGIGRTGEVFEPKEGRWPANVIMDEEAGAMLDAQTGTLTSGKAAKGGHRRTAENMEQGSVVYGGGRGISGTSTTNDAGSLYGDTGGASRFFYSAKASKSERNAGLGDKKCDHPTVKPISLMRYLIRLVTPPNGLVLDPFVGSGSTGIAAKLEGFNFIGVELDAEYAAIARARIEHWE